MSREVFVISPDSGLIGIPKKLANGAENDTAKGKYGYEIVYFLNGAIGVADFIKLESKEVTGYFRVDTIEHSGDNLEGEWFSAARVYEV
ncbi:hypothetical protein FACS1894105_09760 [Clostridia bacterium]|nr:hypothetical protein FACS1894105_09760 [Clostridia bacterium]